MILTSERLSSVIFSGFFLQILFNKVVLDLIGMKRVDFIAFSIGALFILMVFISVLAHRDFVKELYQNAVKQYPNAFA